MIRVLIRKYFQEHPATKPDNYPKKNGPEGQYRSLKEKMSVRPELVEGWMDIFSWQARRSWFDKLTTNGLSEQHWPEGPFFVIPGNRAHLAQVRSGHPLARIAPLPQTA